ncbi:MAG: ATP-binding protein [Syntrophales bacterium]|nr:ATP-binding protein [Syntrophales bacterium]MDY0044614.1 ATP-binding protein [Syntrophales bacterium]
MKISVWLAAASLIVLIFLLALTVNHAREKDLAAQFGDQHVAIAAAAAAGIEDLIAGAKKNLSAFAQIVERERFDTEKTKELMKLLYDSVGHQIRLLAMTNSAGELIFLWPDNKITTEEHPYSVWQTALREAKVLPESTATLPIRIPEGNRGSLAGSAIVVPVPLYTQNNEYKGSVLAFLLLGAVVDRYAGPSSRREATDSWLVDENGIIMAHSNPYIVGMDVTVLAGDDAENSKKLREIFSRGAAGFVTNNIMDEMGNMEKNIIAYAPVYVEDNRWTLALVTPYGIVIDLMRRVFINIMLGAAVLIFIVIAAAFIIGFIAARQLKAEEELKLLKEREDWQSKLLREHKTIEGIIGGSPIPTMVIDTHHRIILWNKACAYLTGYDAAEMIGTDKHYLPLYKEKRPLIADIIIDQNFEILDHYYGTKEVKKSDRVEGAFEAYDFYENLGGKKRYLYFLAAPIYDENGNITAAIETLQDITKEKELELSLKENTENLRNKLEENIKLRKEIEGLYNYLQSIIDTMPEKVYDLSGEGVINYVSRDNIKQEGLYGISQLKGKHFADFVDPENRQFVLQKWEEGKKGIFTPYEIKATARDGSKRDLLITPRPVPDTDRTILVQQDITALKALEKKSFENEKLAALGQLSAGIAHELRNALSSIKMSLQILEKRMAPVGNDQKRFKIAAHEVGHLEQLVNDVLIYAKPADPKKEIADMGAVLDHALDMADTVIANKKISVKKIYDDVPKVIVDPSMLGQAYLNIIYNAVDAMEEGGVLTITIERNVEDAKRVIVNIEDDGCGIDEEDLSSLFNPFFTKKKYGTGLGLAQVKKIIDLHQGSIEITSIKGRGTKVNMIFSIEESLYNDNGAALPLESSM